MDSRRPASLSERTQQIASKIVMAHERSYFAPGDEPEVFTMNICERLFDEAHDQCPGWMKYDPELMESARATEEDTVFCVCPCHKRPQA
jgi:hypothetical protein